MDDDQYEPYTVSSVGTLRHARPFSSSSVFRFHHLTLHSTIQFLDRQIAMKIAGIASLLFGVSVAAVPAKRSSCSPNGSLVCNGPELFGLCNFGSVTFQSVAAGTECVDGTIQAASGDNEIVKKSSCSPNGALICNGKKHFGLCNFGSVTFQSVAAGTQCVDGTIQTAGQELVKKSSCSPNGALICNGPTLQGLCNFGSVIFQPVAAGTKCENGAIVTA